MRRRFVGVCLVVGVFIAAAAVGPRLGPGVAGNPTAGPLPPAPLPGTCLADGVAGLRAVSCETPHDAEVTQSWAAWNPMLTAAEPTNLRAGCRTAAQRYLGGTAGPAPTTFVVIPSGPGWRPLPLTVTSDLVRGPNPHDPIGYDACVVRVAPTVAGVAGPTTVVGRLGELLPMDRRPDALRTCYLIRDPGVPAVPCNTWHLGEAVAAQIVSVTDLAAVPEVIADPTRLASCRDEAAAVVGVGDATFGGRLRLAVDGRVLQSAPVVRSGVWSVQVTVQVRCLVEAADGQRLTGSVIDLGTRALPVR